MAFKAYSVHLQAPSLSLRTLLHWFLQEQREEVASMSDLLSTVERASESNILLAEDYLARPN
jgi:ferritin